jgi:hypothetical protein
LWAESPDRLDSAARFLRLDVPERGLKLEKNEGFLRFLRPREIKLQKGVDRI